MSGRPTRRSGRGSAKIGGESAAVGDEPPQVGRVVSRCFVDPLVLAFIMRLHTFAGPIAAALHLLYVYFEHEVVLRPGEGAEIIRQRDAFKDIFLADDNIGERGNLGQPLTKKRHLVAFGFAVFASILYEHGLEPGDKMDVDNASLYYFLVNMLRSPCLQAGTPVEGFSTLEAAEIFLECFDMFDASSVCCEGTNTDKSGNKWTTAKPQLEKLAALLVPGLSPEDCKLFFPAVYILANLAPRVAYVKAETGKSAVLLNACVRNMTWIHGGAKAHDRSSKDDYDVLQNDILKVLNVSHPEYTNRWMKSALFTREIQTRHAEHFALFFSELPVGDGISIPAFEEFMDYYDRRSGRSEETEEEREARREAMFETCQKARRIANRNIALRCSTVTGLLSDLLDEGTFDDAYDRIGEVAPNELPSYQHKLDLFAGHLAAIRECMEDEANVHEFRDGMLMVLAPAPSKSGDSDNGSSDGPKNTQGYIRDLSKRAKGERGAWEWQLKALWKEGIDLSRYDEGVDAIMQWREDKKEMQREQKRAKRGYVDRPSDEEEVDKSVAPAVEVDENGALNVNALFAAATKHWPS